MFNIEICRPSRLLSVNPYSNSLPVSLAYRKASSISAFWHIFVSPLDSSIILFLYCSSLLLFFQSCHHHLFDSLRSLCMTLSQLITCSQFSVTSLQPVQLTFINPFSPSQRFVVSPQCSGLLLPAFEIFSARISFRVGVEIWNDQM